MKPWIAAAAFFAGIFALLWVNQEIQQRAGADMLDDALTSNNYCKWPNLSECSPGMYYVGGSDVPSLFEFIEREIDYRLYMPTEACEHDRLLTHFKSREEYWQICKLDEFPSRLDQLRSMQKAITGAYNDSRR